MREIELTFPAFTQQISPDFFIKLLSIVWESVTLVVTKIQCFHSLIKMFEENLNLSRIRHVSKVKSLHVIARLLSGLKTISAAPAATLSASAAVLPGASPQMVVM